jgi:hypothetical protein
MCIFLAMVLKSHLIQNPKTQIPSVKEILIKKENTKQSDHRSTLNPKPCKAVPKEQNYQKQHTLGEYSKLIPMCHTNQ